MARIDDKILSAYLKTKRVVVFSSLATGRDLRRLLISLGATPDNVIVAESFTNAKNELVKPTHILVTELFYEGSSGLDLIQYQEEQFENRMEIATIVLSQGPSNVSLGMIAEDNVDAVLLKPFTMDSFRTAVEQAVAQKINPAPLWKLIETGKALIKKKQLDQALIVFEEAKAKFPNPPLAFYYLSQVYRTKGLLKEAIASIQEGLQGDPKDYRCLLLSVDLRVQQEDWSGAYQIAKQFHSEYPVNLKRIPDLVRLSVHLGKYEDIVDYTKIFKELERKDGAISKVVVAGLLVCSKFFLRKQDIKTCHDILKDTVKISMEQNVLKLDVYRYLIDSGLYSEADTFVSKLPVDVVTKPEVRLLTMELYKGSSRDELVLKEGHELLKSGFESDRALELMIESAIKLKRPESEIDQLRKRGHGDDAPKETPKPKIVDRIKSLFN